MASARCCLLLLKAIFRNPQSRCSQHLIKKPSFHEDLFAALRKLVEDPDKLADCSATNNNMMTYSCDINANDEGRMQVDMALDIAL